MAALGLTLGITRDDESSRAGIVAAMAANFHATKG